MGFGVSVSVLHFFVASMARAPLHHLHCVMVTVFEILDFVFAVVWWASGFEIWAVLVVCCDGFWCFG